MVTNTDGLIAALRAYMGEARVVDARPEIVRRLGSGVWVQRPPGHAPRVRQYVVHHSAAGPQHGLVDLWAYHVQSRKWATGGYAVGVREDGTVEVAAGPEHMTYGAGPAWNPSSLYVVCCGDYEGSEPPAATLGALYRVLCVLDDALGGKPWRGHREIQPGHTACPGAHLIGHVQAMRGPRYGSAVPRPGTYP